MRNLIFASLWIALFPMVLFSTHIGVLIWIWLSLSTPQEKIYDIVNGVQFNRIVAIMTFITVMIRKEKKDFYLDTTTALYTLFVIQIILADQFALSSYDFGFVIEKVVKTYALYMMINGIMYTRHRIHMAVFAYCIGLAMESSFEGAAFVLTGAAHKVYGTPGLGDNNGAALAVLLSIPMCYFCLQYASHKLMRLGLIGLIVLSALTVVATYSRGGFVGLLICGFFLIGRTRKKLPIVLMVGVIGIGLSYMVGQDWIDRINSIGQADDNGSFLGRVMAWKISLLMAIDHPIFGGGLNAVTVYNNWRVYAPVASTMGILDIPDPGYALAAHNIFFEVLGDTGFPGLFMFAGILAVNMFNCSRIIHAARKDPSLGWAGDMARMMQVSLIIYVTAGSLLSYAYYESYWILIAISSRLNHTVMALRAAKPVRDADGFLAEARPLAS